MNNNDKIIQIITEKPGLKAKEIAKLLGLKKKEVNSALYGTLNSKLVRDDFYHWWLKTTEVETKTAKLTQNLTTPHMVLDHREEFLPVLEETNQGYETEQVKKKPTEEAVTPVSKIMEVNRIHSRKDVTSDDPEIDPYNNYSLPYPTAKEESELWRKFIKWRHIKGIIDSENILKNISEASSIIISQIAKEISISHNLVALLRRYAGLEELGDTIIEDAKNNTNTAIELYRLIQYSKKKHGEKIERNNGETCCLEDLFGYYFGEALNNIVFGKGNPNLVDKITKATNDSQTDVVDKLCRLAVNRELLPRSLMKLINPRTPLDKLPVLIEDIRPDYFSECVLNDYQTFILNIKLEGEKAFSKIIGSHLRQVVDIANKFITKDTSLPIDDLVQEGSIGLIKAAERYNPAYGYRFMSYAPMWIHQAIPRAMADQARTIRIPVHMAETIDQLLKVSRRLAQEYGREPTSTEIAKEMEISSDKVREIVKVSQLPISLESPIGEEEDSPLGNSIEDRNAPSPVDAASKQLLKEQIEDVLDTLTNREQRVIELRFGLEDGRSRTLEEVGYEFGVTRERIRQIEAKALRKLRHPSRSRKLKEYLE